MVETRGRILAWEEMIEEASSVMQDPEHSPFAVSLSSEVAERRKEMHF